MPRSTLPLASLALLLAITLAGLLGGPRFAPDLQTDMWFIGWRHEHVQLTRAMIAFTQLGGSAVLLPVVALAGAWLLWRGERREALLFFGTTLTGRMTIELLKIVIDRPRPSFDPHPVFVASKSFPSAHAGNSTLTYVSLALFLVPGRWRVPAAAAAMTLAIAIGCTRPMLGVHWPSDVLAGWCFGLLWVSLSWQLSRRGAAAASGYSPASPAAGQG